MAARTSSSWLFSAGTVSAANAFSIRGSRDSSLPLDSVLMAFARTCSSFDSSCSAASALSSSPRIRLLLMTSSASSGSFSAAPVTGSDALSSRTTNTCSPAVLTASSASAWMNAAVFRRRRWRPCSVPRYATGCRRSPCRAPPGRSAPAPIKAARQIRTAFSPSREISHGLKSEDRSVHSHENCKFLATLHRGSMGGTADFFERGGSNDCGG